MTAPPQTGTATRYGQIPMFSGGLAFLSNFDPTPFWVPTLLLEAHTAEHAFNALKTSDPKQQAWVLTAPTPAEAKRRGRSRQLALRAGWDTGVRVRAMQTVLLAKFALPQLADQLAATGNLHLIETNYWHDQFWGSCFCPTHAEIAGVNMLGELLMALRVRSLRS